MHVLHETRDEQRPVETGFFISSAIEQRHQRVRRELRVGQQTLYSFFTSISSPIPTSSPSLSPIFVGSAG